MLAVRLRSLESRLEALTRGGDGASLEGVLSHHLERVGELAVDVGHLVARTDRLETEARRAFRRIGLVRFNPFEDTGGNQSFALAVLDEEGDGVIVTSLHARGLTRIYGKAIVRGRPEAALSDEESEALAVAGGGDLGRGGLSERIASGERAARIGRSERAGA